MNEKYLVSIPTVDLRRLILYISIGTFIFNENYKILKKLNFANSLLEGLMTSLNTKAVFTKYKKCLLFLTIRQKLQIIKVHAIKQYLQCISIPGSQK